MAINFFFPGISLYFIAGIKFAIPIYTKDAGEVDSKETRDALENSNVVGLKDPGAGNRINNVNQV